ncbi:MAG: ASCH domain-containing protein [Spirochaetia bacterium]|jgi:hypothetical protein
MTNKRPYRAISIRQPYAEQILQGKKRFEYRSRPTTIRERVFIYAALKEAAGAEPSDYKPIGKDFESLPKGVIVGSVEICDCKSLGRRGGYAFKLARPIRLGSPRKAKNQPQPMFWMPVF